MKKVKFSLIVLLALTLVCSFAAACSTPPKKYTVSFAAENAQYGIVTCVDKNDAEVVSGTKHNKGTSLTLTATANTGYTFDGWYVDGVKESDQATYTFAVSKEVNYTAKFTLNAYQLSFISEDSDKGTVSADGISSGDNVNYNASVTLTATANTGYEFIGWYVNGQERSTQNPFTFDMPASAYSIEARFDELSYELTFAPNNSEMGNVIETSGIKSGDEIDYKMSFTLLATANTGYEFIGWYVNDEEVGTQTTYTYNMPASAYSVEARFDELSYELTFAPNNSEMGTVTENSGIESGDDVDFKTSFTLTATANTGYKFIGWYVNGQEVGTQTTYTYNMPAKAYSVEARFDEVSYKLTFAPDNSEMGIVTENSGIKSGDDVDYKTSFTLTATANTGYKFIGWYVNDEEVGTQTTYTYNMPANAYSVEARFIPEIRKVTFYDGYDRLHVEEVNYNEVVTLYTYTKSNYNFIGWFTDPTFETLYDSDAKVTENISLYAKLERTIVTYDVVFVNDDGSALSGVQTVEEGQTVPHLPGTPVKQGYEFAGWVVYDEQLGEDVPFDESDAIVSDLTVKASYTIKTFTVTFYLDKEMTKVFNTQTVDYKDVAVKPTTPTDEENIFVKWVYADNQTVDFDFASQITENMNMIAVWEAKPAETFTVEFYDKEGGTLLDTQLVVEGGSATAPADPVKEGYTFIGWDKEFDNVTKNISVYAEFEIKTFKVVFKDVDGTILKEEQTVEFGSAAVAPADPDKTGYTFIGWDKEFDNVKEDLVIVAKYDIHTFTATFIDKESDLTISTVEDVEFGSTLAVPVTPTKAGYSFIGWYADENYSEVYNFNAPVSTNVNIYAKFQIIEVAKYTVKFVDPQGLVISEQLVVEGNSAIEPNAPAKEGYNFVSWDKAFDEITADTTVTAIYQAKTYKVTFMNIDGTVQLSQVDVEYNTSAQSKAPTAPIIAGKTFSRWSKDISVITKDIVVLAVYTTQTRTVYFTDGTDVLYEVKVEYGTCVNIPNTPTKIGHIFKYWHLENDSNAFDFSTPIESDVTLIAEFEQFIGMFTVTFYGADGNVYGNIQVVADNYYAIEPAPYDDGTDTEYVWCLEDSNVAFDFENTKITANVELYAKEIAK